MISMLNYLFEFGEIIKKSYLQPRTQESNYAPWLRKGTPRNALTRDKKEVPEWLKPKESEETKRQLPRDGNGDK